MKKSVVIILALFSFIIFACDTNAGTVKLTVNETAAEVSEVTDETIRLNNCGGTAAAEQTVEKSRTIYVEGNGVLGVDGQVVKGEVSAKYGESVGYTKSQKLTAAPGTNMEFVLRWTEKTWVGFVSSQGKNGQATYKVSVPISAELISSVDLGNCPTKATPATIAPVNQSEFVYREATGWDEKWINYNITLQDGEIISGQGTGFSIDGIEIKPCATYLLKGPGTYNFSVYIGAWKFYRNVFTSQEAESLLQWQIDSQIQQGCQKGTVKSYVSP